MSVTGMALILFLTFHGCMNVVALISGNGYNMICRFLGSNWYAVAATVALVALIAIHIIYAFVLTLQNRKARGNNRYKVTEKPDKVEWSSQNMLVLGIVVLLGMLLHLYNFWYNMMFAELAGNAVCPGPTNGFAWIAQTFCCSTTCGKIYTAIYVIWLVAIWFHLTHGFWSAIQTVGWSGHIWFKRWKVIGNIYITLVMLMFLAVVVGFATGTAPSLKAKDAPALCLDCKCPANQCGSECKKCGECPEGEAMECKCEEMKAHCMKGGGCPDGPRPLPECCKPDAECCKPGAECCPPCPEAPECCKPGAECCKPGAECCKPDKNPGRPAPCPGCGKEEPCCTPGEGCQHCDAQNGECCAKPGPEEPAVEGPAPEEPVAEEPAPEPAEAQ